MGKVVSADRERGRRTEREIQEATPDCPIQVIACYLRSRNLPRSWTHRFRHWPSPLQLVGKTTAPAIMVTQPEEDGELELLLLLLLSSRARGRSREKRGSAL